MENFSFESFELDRGVYQLRDTAGFCASLLIGSERALLFDTMGGAGDIQAYVKSRTNKPLTVVNSHIHYDHTGGNAHFDSVWLSPLDLPYNIFGKTRENRIELADCIAEAAGESFTKERYDAIINGAFDRYLPLEPGQRFDLGNLTAEAVALPGHTPGSMGLLLAEQGLLLSGDAMTPVMCLFFPESLPLEDYKKTLAYATTLPFGRFITGHMVRALPKETLADFMAAADAVPALRGMRFTFDMLPIYGGTLYLYATGQAEEDTLGVILKN